MQYLKCFALSLVCALVACVPVLAEAESTADKQATASPVTSVDSGYSPGAQLSEIQRLAEEVDVLMILSQLELTESQLKFVADKASELNKQREETRKKEMAILQEIKDHLRKMRDILIAGKDIPTSLQSAVTPKLKDLQNIRQQAWEAFQSKVGACVRQLSEGQIRKIARTPEVQRKASEIVQRVRTASENSWPKVKADITQELLEIKKLDKQEEWQSELDRLATLPEEQKESALKEFEKQKAESISEMQTEIEQMLTSIRVADPRILSVATNKVATALRTQADIKEQLFAAFARILDSPCGEQALRSKIGGTNSGPTDSPKDNGSSSQN